MCTLKLNLLGPFRVSTNGRPADGFASDKVRALLAYLAAEHGQPHRRDFLAGLLWPQSPQKQARASLRRALANLRQVIGDRQADPPFLLISPQTIQLNLNSAVTFDLFDLEAAAAAEIEGRTAQVERALGGYAGRFMTGFSLPGSSAFEEWLLLQQERCQRLAAELLWRLANYHDQAYQPARALPFAWRLVELDPWQEESQRLLMRLLAKTGQRAAALQQVRRFRAELKRELGIDLDPQTMALWRSIKAGSGERRERERPKAAPRVRVIGRRQELDALKELFNSAQTAGPQAVFVVGDAGSGKTALIHALLDQLPSTRQSPAVLEGHGQNLAGRGDAYWPWSTAFNAFFSSGDSFLVESLLDHAPDLIETLVFWPVLRDLVRRLPDPNLEARLKRVVERQRRTAAPLVKRKLFQQASSFLQVIARQRPVVVVLDDMQWADPDSVDLLFDLGRRKDLTGVLLITAWRPAEVALWAKPVSKGVDRRHPLIKAVNELQRQPGGLTIDLNGCDGRQFLDCLLDDEPNLLDESFRAALFRQTAGHPLFTVELLNHLKQQGQLRRHRSGRWTAGDDLDWETLPGRIEAVLTEKIDRLSDRYAALLTIASAAGDQFAVEVIARAAGLEEQELIAIFGGPLARDYQLITLHSCRWLGRQRLSIYRFRHAVCASYLYHQLDEAQRSYVHENLAVAMVSLIEEQSYPTNGWAGQIAHHFLQAGRPDRALKYCQQAGSEALRLAAYTQALAHFQQGLSLLDHLSDAAERDRWEMDLQLAVGIPLLSLKGYNAPEVGEAYERALALTPIVEQASVADRVNALFWLTSFYAVSGRYQQGLSLARQMVSLTSGAAPDDITLVLAHVLTGMPLYLMGRLQEAEIHFQQALDAYRPAIHQDQVHLIGQDPGSAAHAWLCMIYTHRGQGKVASRFAKRSLQISAELNHPYTRAFALLIAGLSPPLFFKEMDDPAGIAAVEELAQLADRYEFKSFHLYASYYKALIRAYQALANQDQTASQQAIDQMTAALNEEKAFGHVAGLSSRLFFLAQLYQQFNRVSAALRAVREAQQFIKRTGECYFESEIYRLYGELLLAQNPIDHKQDAAAALQHALNTACAQGAGLFEQRAAAAVARLHAPENDDLARITKTMVAE